MLWFDTELKWENALLLEARASNRAREHDMQQDFSTAFEELTGFPPLPWQSALYERFVSGEYPDSANIPTGLGKTSVVAIWLIALANKPHATPHRLVYVVNRRTVVDQTTTEVEKLYQRLSNKPELASLAAQLRELTALPCETPLAISTLRGQYTDNGEWKSDPSRPAIIVGTVDLIGSGLLFSHYRAGFKTKPLYAAFLGQDALLVHDEAHLEPAFQKLLEAIKITQSGSDFRPLRIMALTATSRSGGTEFGLTEADTQNAIVKKRFTAVKKLTLIQVDDIGEAIIAKTKDFTSGNILVYVRSVELALKIASELDKHARKGAVITLTGTMRGKERDELVNDPRFQRFLPSNGNVDPNLSPVFLVATSAGEVGVNISADHCVCDLSMYDSMCQRFGRVNRFGECVESSITVFHESVFGEIARERTFEVLKALNGDASPKALAEHPAPEAFSPPPEIRVATAIQFDAWTLTSIRAPIAARPPVAPYLHGEAEWQPPETHLAWRDDCDFEHVADHEDFLDRFPLRPQELLRDTTKRIVASLEKLTVGRTSLPDAWIIDDRGSVSEFSLSNFDKERAATLLADATLVLPSSLGGLSGQGLFDAKAPAATADVSGIERRESSSREHADLAIQVPTEGDDEPRYWLWFAHDHDSPASPRRRDERSAALDEHQKTVMINTAAISAKLNLPSGIQDALINAAQHHDDGKARREWQLAIGNRDYPRTVLAKPAPDANPRNLVETYRHEFGSLSSLSGLAFHCVAAHHGRARPHYPREEIFDPADTPSASAALAAQVPPRFAALQRQYGRWGLAYLESILRAADYAASASIVATAMPPSPVAASQVDSPAFPPTAVNTSELALDPANPGHYFACCGLFELASRLHPDTMAHFDENRFILRSPITLADLFGKITAADITAASDSGSVADDRKDDEDSSMSEGEGEASAPPLFVGDPFNIRLDWWITGRNGDTSALKVWAGSMKVLRIAKSMLFTLGEIIGTGAFDYGNILLEMRSALDPLKIKTGEAKYIDKYSKELKSAQEKRDEMLRKAETEKNGAKLKAAVEKIEAKYAASCAKAEVDRNRNLEQLRLTSKTEPFYFDAKRGPNADSRDVGFSPNDLKMKTLASPAVEFLCLVGLQRAIPQPAGNRLFDYHLWAAPIPISILAAAVNGLVQREEHPAYRFESWYRTSQRKHKAFLSAKPN